MTKDLLRIKAETLRKEGLGIANIADSLGVSKSSVSYWCRNLVLSKSQIGNLLKSQEDGSARGRAMGAMTQKIKRIKKIKSIEKEAKENFKSMSEKEFWFAGLALYLAEGSKKMLTVQFTNSDARVIKLMLKWFRRFFGTTKKDCSYYVLIDSLHRKREKDIEEYWKNLLNLGAEQSVNIRYTNTVKKKRYSNHDNYFGTFSFRIYKSTDMIYRLRAYIDRFFMLKIVG